MVVLRVVAFDDREERLLEAPRDRAALAATDLAVVDVAHRRDFRGRSRQEHLVGRVELVASDRFLTDVDALLPQQRDGGVAGDALQDRGRRRRRWP